MITHLSDLFRFWLAHKFSMGSLSLSLSLGLFYTASTSDLNFGYARAVKRLTLTPTAFRAWIWVGFGLGFQLGAETLMSKTPVPLKPKVSLSAQAVGQSVCLSVRVAVSFVVIKTFACVFSLPFSIFVVFIRLDNCVAWLKRNKLQNLSPRLWKVRLFFIVLFCFPLSARVAGCLLTFLSIIL